MKIKRPKFKKSRFLKNAIEKFRHLSLLQRIAVLAVFLVLIGTGTVFSYRAVNNSADKSAKDQTTGLNASEQPANEAQQTPDNKQPDSGETSSGSGGNTASGASDIDCTVAPTSLTFIEGSPADQVITMQSVNGANLSYGQDGGNISEIFFNHAGAGANPTTGAFKPKVSISNSLAPGTYSFKVYCQQLKPYKKITKTLTIIVKAKPYFELAPQGDYGELDGSETGCGEMDISINRFNGFTDTIRFSAALQGNPSGMSTSVDNDHQSDNVGTVTVCITSPVLANPGTYTVLVNGFSTSDETIADSTSFEVEVY